MCMSTHVCSRIRVHAHACPRTCTRVHTARACPPAHMHTRMLMCVHSHTHTCACPHMLAHADAHVHTRCSHLCTPTRTGTLACSCPPAHVHTCVHSPCTRVHMHTHMETYTHNKVIVQSNVFREKAKAPQHSEVTPEQPVRCSPHRPRPGTDRGQGQTVARDRPPAWSCPQSQHKRAADAGVPDLSRESGGAGGFGPPGHPWPGSPLTDAGPHVLGDAEQGSMG